MHGTEPEGRKLFERHKEIWEGNIKLDLKTIRCEDVDWIHLAHSIFQWEALVNVEMNHWVAYKVGNFLTI
jgi:hypothetical protein